ncbi:MAG: helix-turn-helix transcriptional regulator [Solobacterium sp.]|nr:helix-turn-helix transcriptional regulator [Solobacterium sp.]
MTIKEQIKLFLELLNLSFPIYYWVFSKTLEQKETNYPLIAYQGDLLKLLKLKEEAQPVFSNKKTVPFIFENQIGLCFMCDYSQTTKEFYMLGPIWNGNDIHDALHKIEYVASLSPKEEYTLITNLKRIPIVNTPDLFRYSMQLHYLINKEYVPPQQIEVLSSSFQKSSQSLENHYDSHAGIYESEQRFLSLVEEGNIQAVSQIYKLSSQSSGIRFQNDSSILSAKLNLTVLLTLVSRVAINGGLSPAISYSLNDLYGSAIESSTSLAELNKLSTKIVEDYINRVHEAKQNAHISQPIQHACHYIQVHLEEPLSISHLAKEIGYSTYYFSTKFQKEMGCSVNQYVLSKRIERAKILLQNPSLQINDIYEQLCFGSRNHFYSTFKAFTGESPSSYRKSLTNHKKG